MPDDMTLLREYSRRNTEEAFATLVSPYANLVYSVVLRDVRDPHLAEESRRRCSLFSPGK